MVGLGTLLLVIVLIWRVFVIEGALHERVDGIDSSLGAVVGMMIEKIDAIGNRVPDINLINENPLAQLFDFLKGNDPRNKIPPLDDMNNRGNHPPQDSTGQFVEVKSEENATQKKEGI